MVVPQLRKQNAPTIEPESSMVGVAEHSWASLKADSDSGIAVRSDKSEVSQTSNPEVSKFLKPKLPEGLPE